MTTELARVSALFVQRPSYGLHWGRGVRSIVVLGECRGGLNLSRPTFALSAGEYRALRDPQLASDFAQTDSCSIGCFNLLPTLRRNSAAPGSVRCWLLPFSRSIMFS